MVCNRHRPTRRSELIEAIWPEQAPAAADNALNALISKLPRVLGPETLDRRANLQLQLGDPWVDVEAAVEAVHRAESAIAVSDWTRAWGPALVALFTAEREFPPSDEAPWVDDQRARLAAVHLRALRVLRRVLLGHRGDRTGGRRSCHRRF